MNFQDMFNNMQTSINDVMQKKEKLETAMEKRRVQMEALDKEVGNLDKEYQISLEAARKVRTEWDSLLNPILPPAHLEGRVRGA